MAKAQVSKEVLEKCRVMAPEFRVAFPHLFKPSGMPGTPESTHKYSMVMLFSKSTDLSALKEAMKWAKIARFGKDKTQWPKMALPINDGDTPNTKGEIPDGYKGCWAVTAKSGLDRKPGVVNESNEYIMDPSAFYAGCYAHAQLFAYVWEFPQNSGKFGIGFQINGVQKTKDGKPFGNRKAATEIFAPITDTGVDKDDDTSDDDDDDEEGYF